jgi:hypothetical protein
MYVLLCVGIAGPKVGTAFDERSHTDELRVYVARMCAGSLAPGWLAIGGSTAATPNWDTFPLCTVITVTFLFPGALWLNVRTALHSLLERRAIEPPGPYKGECLESAGLLLLLLLLLLLVGHGVYEVARQTWRPTCLIWEQSSTSRCAGGGVVHGGEAAGAADVDAGDLGLEHGLRALVAAHGRVQVRVLQCQDVGSKR